MKEKNRIRKDLNNNTSGWWLRSAYIFHPNYSRVSYAYVGLGYGDYVSTGGVVITFVI